AGVQPAKMRLEDTHMMASRRTRFPLLSLSDGIWRDCPHKFSGFKRKPEITFVFGCCFFNHFGFGY
ncbi:hypothetical protein D6Q35_22700, partial [Salmonella enterica subsp. enterica serovar Heidelberg]|nr:hypothetical protein [Salmonella enterica subsp. enterica serovar Heidelberg]